MSAKLKNLSVDFILDQVKVLVESKEVGGIVALNCQLSTEGDQSESQLRKAGKKAAIALLEEAISVLQDD